MRVISQEIPQPSITKFSLKVIYLEFQSVPPGANELKSPRGQWVKTDSRGIVYAIMSLWCMEMVFLSGNVLNFGQCSSRWFSDSHQAYHQTSNIGSTEIQNLNVSRLVLQLSLPSPLKPGVKSRMKIYSELRQQAVLQLHLSDQQFYCLLDGWFCQTGSSWSMDKGLTENYSPDKNLAPADMKFCVICMIWESLSFPHITNFVTWKVVAKKILKPASVEFIQTVDIICNKCLDQDSSAENSNLAILIWER